MKLLENKNKNDAFQAHQKHLNFSPTKERLVAMVFGRSMASLSIKKSQQKTSESAAVEMKLAESWLSFLG